MWGRDIWEISMPSLQFCYEPKTAIKNSLKRGTWVAQSVERPTSAQVMISWFMGLSPMLGSVLTVWSESGACFSSVSPSFSAPPPAHALSLSVSQK